MADRVIENPIINSPYSAPRGILLSTMMASLARS